MGDWRDDANVLREDENLLAEREQVRTEGHAPAPVVPGLSAAELEAELIAVGRLLDGGEFGAATDAVGEIIERLQRRLDPVAPVPVTIHDFDRAPEAHLLLPGDAIKLTAGADGVLMVTRERSAEPGMAPAVSGQWVPVPHALHPGDTVTLVAGPDGAVRLVS
jgi:hypothetical protein